MQIAAALCTFIEDQLRRVADHEILLVNTKNSSFLVAVIRIQEQRQIFQNPRLVKIDPVLNDAFVHRVRIEQSQSSAFAMITGDGDFIHDGADIEISEMNRVAFVRAANPVFAVPLQPVIRGFILLVPYKVLFEKSAVISQADAVCRQSEGCQRVDEAGRQTAETAVAQGRLIFIFFQFRKVFACRSQFFLHTVVQSQIDQIVAHELADQELGRDVIQLLLSRIKSLFLRRIIDQTAYSVKNFKIRTFCDRFTKIIRYLS